MLKVLDRETGEDLLPLAKERVLAQAPGRHEALFKRILEVFDVFTFPSDDHIGEYVPYAEEFVGVQWLFGKERKAVRLIGDEQVKSWIDEYLESDGDPSDTVLRPSGEIAVPILCDIELDRHRFREAVNVLNSDRYITNLPSRCAVEVPAMVDAKGIHPVHVGEIPEPFAAIIRTQATICELLTEAYSTGSRKRLLQALLLDPVVNSVSKAEKMLDQMLKLQRDFLPELR